MLFLSEIPGRFPVGATTFATPVRPPRTVGSAKLQGTKQPALNLDEVAFTVYYPTDVIAVSSAAKGLNWMLRPVKETLRGLASFSAVSLFVIWPLVYLFGTFIKIPVYPNAPLLHPKKAKPCSSVSEEKFISEQWPLVIFSHGLGGSRTAYSQLCSRIAASGKVVLALEHRDGTGYAAMRRTWDAERKYLSKPIIYYQKEDVILDEDPTKDANPLPLRTEQLDFRRQEIYIAYETFSRFIRQGPASELSVLDDSTMALDSWRPVDSVIGDEPICCSEGVTLAGHSFGGCTVISILSTDPPEGCGIIPATNALILDPWVEPFPTNNPTPRYPTSSSASIGSASTEHSTSPTETPNLGSEAVDLSKHDSRLPRMLVINSETFTLWQDHFAKLQDIVKSWEPHGRRIITLVGSGHTAFSDFPVLPLIRTKGSQMLMDIISKLSIAFIDGELEQAVGSASERSMQIEIVGKAGDGRPKRKLVGTIGDIIVS